MQFVLSKRLKFSVTVLVIFCFASGVANAHGNLDALYRTTEANLDTPLTHKPHVVTRADLEFGEEQLKKLLNDRKAMNGYVRPGDPVWNQAVRGFAGETCGYRVYWNPEDLDKPIVYAADHCFPYPPLYKPFIRLRAYGPNHVPYSGEYMWACLFFEMFNLANHTGFKSIYEKALTGTVSKEEWITENTKLEFLAVKRSINFYREYWRPQMKTMKIRTVPAHWKDGEKEDYQSWIAQYSKSDYYPYDFWGKYYDDSVVPYLKKMAEWRQQMKEWREKYE